MSFSILLGVMLLLWVAWDLYSGTVWAHREISRRSEPLAYWSMTAVWTAVAVSCIFLTV